MLCPNCKDIALVMSERKEIEIDYCPQCRGVWLDRGELDKIIESSLSEQAPSAQQAAPGTESHGGGIGSHRQPYRKKSIWHDIFD